MALFKKNMQGSIFELSAVFFLIRRIMANTIAKNRPFLEKVEIRTIFAAILLNTKRANLKIFLNADNNLKKNVDDSCFETF